MGLVRIALIALVTIATAVAGAFDGCLLDCHAQAPVKKLQVTAHAHCHPAPAQQASVRWQADSACHHDHTSAAAESTSRNRLESRILGIVVSLATHPDRLAISIVPVARSIDGWSAPTLDLVPLRI